MAIRIATRATGTVYRAYFKHQGRQYQKSLRTKAEAKTWEVEEKKRLKALPNTPQSMPFSLACEIYLEDCEARMTPGTFAEKRCHLRELAAYIKKDDAMENVTLATARQFLLKIKATHGNKAANRRLRTLKALWNWHKDRLPHNPWKGLVSFSEEEYVKYVPSPEDIGKVLEVAEPWQRDMLEVLLHSGARISEALNLRWEDVSERTMQLWTQKRKNGSRATQGRPARRHAESAHGAASAKNRLAGARFHQSPDGQPLFGAALVHSVYAQTPVRERERSGFRLSLHSALLRGLPHEVTKNRADGYSTALGPPTRHNNGHLPAEYGPAARLPRGHHRRRCSGPAAIGRQRQTQKPGTREAARLFLPCLGGYFVLFVIVRLGYNCRNQVLFLNYAARWGSSNRGGTLCRNVHVLL